MSNLSARTKSLVSSIFRRERLESEIDTEIRFHIESRTEDLVREGLTPREAARRARQEFGTVATHKDGIRQSLGLRRIDEFWTDLVYATRILSKSPGFTAVAVASLALAIGANTTIFSYANQVLFVRLGVPHPEQLRVFRLTGDEHIAVQGIAGNDGYMSDDGHIHLGLFPYPAYRQLRQQNHVVEDIVAFTQLPDVDITAAGAPEVGKAELVSGNFYTQMQVKPQVGRPIEPTDDGSPGAGTVAVISDSFWHREFGGAHDVVGKTIRVNLTPVTIIGVNPPSFSGTVAVDTSAPEVFLPLSMMFTLIPISAGQHPLIDPNNFSVQLMARVRPDISTSAAETALDSSFNAAFRGTAIVNKGETVPRLSLEDGSRGITSGVRYLLQPLYVLLGLAGLVLLLACANIANLMLARASFRQREMSVRMALGAGRGRILRQVLTESLLLSAMGGFAGLVLGYVSRNLIPWLMRAGWDGGEMPVGFDWRVFGFTSSVTLITGIVFGIAPAWRSTRADINTALKEGVRTSSRRRKPWSGKAIVGFQVALSTLLVISAIFFLRTLFNLNSVDPGFRTQNLLLVDVTPPRTESLLSQSSTLHSRVKDALASVPGVQEVTYVNHPLGAYSEWRSMFLVEGTQRDPGSDPKKTGHEGEQAMVSYVGPDFFSLMSIPILAGRGFTTQDTETSVPVSVVNQALVRKFFPNTNPIGKRFLKSTKGPNATRWIEIVGICADIRYSDMRQPTPPVHFDLDRQSGAMGSMTYIVRSPLQVAILVPSLRRAVQQIAPDLPLNHIRTQQQQIAASMQQERMFASLTAGFGLLALALACVGIYGIMAYTVSQRTNEIGIRLALGAARAQIRAMVLREAGWLATAGVVVGLGVTIILMRLVRSMLYGLKPSDPLSLTASVLLLLAMALIAGWIPAARASRVEPMDALRHD
jgi:predicted permease